MASKTKGCSNTRSARSNGVGIGGGYLLLVQVLDEVGLALELPLDLLGHHLVEGALLGAINLRALHSLIRWLYIIIRRRSSRSKLGISRFSGIVRDFYLDRSRIDQKNGDG